MYAIFETGSKQYKVKEGDVITVEKLSLEAGASHVFDSVLAISSGDDLKIGTPTVAGAKIEATVIEEGKHKKVIVFKYKPKKGFSKKKGHRQPFTKLKIEKIVM